MPTKRKGTRATYDLDFAILVDSWEQFAIVKQLFLDIRGFTDKERNAQRLYYQPTGASFETIIDIIPFGSCGRLSEQSPGHPMPMSS